MYYVIMKLYIVDGVMTREAIGYVTSEEDKNYVDSTYYSGLSSWIDANIDDLRDQNVYVESYFSPGEVIYQSGWITDDLGDTELTLITDLDNLEG